jgi:hypothetical protein
MPSRHKSGKEAKKHVAQTQKRANSRSHLLIIECDSRKLAADGLNLGSAFGRLAKKVFPKKRIAVVRTSTEHNLKEDLAAAFQEFGRFRSILIVGHSNETGLALTGDGLRSWDVVGNWLQSFEPEFCFLAACHAGRSEAVRNLFKPVRTLRQIYASPAPLYKNQLPPLAMLIGMLLKDGRIDEDQSGALRIVNYFLSGGQLYRWKRQETGPGEELKARLLNSVASLMDQGSWDLLERLFPGVPRPPHFADTAAV